MLKSKMIGSTSLHLYGCVGRTRIGGMSALGPVGPSFGYVLSSCILDNHLYQPHALGAGLDTKSLDIQEQPHLDH